MFKNKTEHKLWLYVLGAMGVIALLWAMVFYPQSLKISRPAPDTGFSDFKTKIYNAWSIFKTAPAAVDEKNDVATLRQQIFGDSTERAQ